MINTFTNIVELKNYAEPACERAVTNTCNRLLGTLQQLIMSEYYDKFVPDKYVRTYQFYESAMMKMLSHCTGEIFMNEHSMDYGNFWNGECQLQFASRGYHGSTEYYTEGRFWNSFIDFCNQNALSILKEELHKQGLTIV